MKILNQLNTDFSEEVILQLALMMDCVMAAELVAYKVSRTLDDKGIKNSLFQMKRKKFNDARRKLQDILRNLEVSFDGVMDNVTHNAIKKYNQPDVLQVRGNDVLQMLLIYSARCDGSPEKAEAMKKALRNFKADPEIDLAEIEKYYQFK